MDDYFYKLAEISAKMVGHNVQPIYIYAQWAHETANFTSDLCVKHYNLGGITQTVPNHLPQPDGELFYAEFNSYEEFAYYFGKYLRFYAPDIYKVNSLKSYISVLKDGGYFGDSYENYLKGVMRYV